MTNSEFDDAMRRYNGALGAEQVAARDRLLFEMAYALVDIRGDGRAVSQAFRSFVDALAVPVPVYDNPFPDLGRQAVDIG